MENIKQIGPVVFIIGLILAVVLGLLPGILGGSSMNVLVLGILGIVVGLLNVSDRELNNYILSNIGFVVASAAFESVLRSLSLGIYSTMLVSVSHNIIFFVVPGLAVVCLREIYQIAKD